MAFTLIDYYLDVWGFVPSVLCYSCVKTGYLAWKAQQQANIGNPPARIIPPPYITDFNPTFGQAGDTITIYGLYLENTTQVKIGTLNCTGLTIVSDREITAIVPSGATRNKVTVVNVSGNHTSTIHWVPGTVAVNLNNTDRIKLTADTILYVSPLGDNTTGITPANGFTTLSGIFDYIKNTYDINGKSITVQIEDGTYTQEFLHLTDLPNSWEASALTGAGVTVNSRIFIKGNTTNPANVTIDVSFWRIVGTGDYNISGIKFNGTPYNVSGVFVSVEKYALCTINSCQFINGTTTPGAKTLLQTVQGGIGVLSSPTIISGTYLELVVASGFGSTSTLTGVVTFSNPCTFTSGVLYARDSGTINEFTSSYVNANNVTGAKIRVNRYGILKIGTALNSLPGTINYNFQTLNPYFQEGEVNGIKYENFWNIATISTTQTLSATSNPRNQYTVTANVNINLPSSTTLSRKADFIIANSITSTGNITMIDTVAAMTIVTIAPGETAYIYAQHSLTSGAATWCSHLVVSRASSIIYNNAASTLISTNLQSALDELKALTNSIEISTVNSDRQLQNNSARIQNLTNPTSTTHNILMPNTPQLAKEFLIINENASLGDLIVNAFTVSPGMRHFIAWNGTSWLKLT
ncbi:MAG: hypothetical protein ACRC11_19785 [Xenococcaceae cyanobacterium]